MKMLDLRVRVDRRHFNLYDDMRQAGVVTEAHVLFFVGACLGFRKNLRSSPKQRQEKFWSRTFAAEEWTCMYCMALAHFDGQLGRIQDDKEVMELMEEYATGGIDFIAESILPEYVLTSSNEPRLDTTAAIELPRALVYELWQMSETPFTQYAGTDFRVSMKRSTQR